MEYTHLPTLIRKLMPMIYVENQRERMTYIALISKALLHSTWSSYSILIYIEFVRDLKLHGTFATPVKPDFKVLPKLTPNTIMEYKTLRISKKKYTEEELKELCLTLMGPVQLWSTKVDDDILRIALKQLVYKTDSLPGESICINSWRHLAFAFMQSHQLIWSVIQPCVDIMKSFKTTEELNELSLLKKITPMLILQTVPKESFDIVELPKSYVDLFSDKFKIIGINPQDIKLCNTQNSYTLLCIELADRLLQSSFDDNNDGSGVKSPVEFYIALLSKIFCK
ncbi:hypothetical protein BD770DRAFT_164252 [Pilaira anomala]|nr:hypothetical protein BD770DRAFT_164252 [Pilaira anomala]